MVGALLLGGFDLCHPCLPSWRDVRGELHVQPLARAVTHSFAERGAASRSATPPDGSTSDPIAAPLRGADLVSVRPRGSRVAHTAPRDFALPSPVALPVV